MLHSMTGFARQIAESPVGTLTCELRTVNHRYLDVQFKLPEEIRTKEVELRQQIGGSVKRGKLECAVHFRHAREAGEEIAINESLVKQIGARVAEVSAMLPDSSPLNPVDVLRWPGVILEREVDTEPLYKEIRELLAATLKSLNASRSGEGERIAEMLKSRCAEIGNIANDVRARIPAVLEAVRKKQQERIAKLDVSADPERLEMELALIAQKLDVDEELDRLDSHIVEIMEVIERDEPVGRRLDFLMQELNREANTLGSKSADTETTRAAVELKVLIEQMREQIQNVE